MWSQHWPLTELRRIDTQARKIISEKGGKHHLGPTALLYLPREAGGRELKPVEMDYKQSSSRKAVKQQRPYTAAGSGVWRTRLN